MLSILCAPLKESISNVASLSPEMQYGRFGLGHVRPLGLNGPAFDAAGLGGMIVPGSLGRVGARIAAAGDKGEAAALHVGDGAVAQQIPPTAQPDGGEIFLRPIKRG